MTARNHIAETNGNVFAKCRTGIAGFDEITLGGLPRGRPTLICGGAGCGKTLFGVEFLVRGARDYGEPGVCISFEETPEDLSQNVRSLGFDLNSLIRRKRLAIDHVEIDRQQIAETGEYDLEGLFIRIGSAIDSVGAKRVLLDTPETLFAGLRDEGILRSELRRLFGWLKSKGVTAVITGERGGGTLTRHGLEEYVSDCVVLLDHRVQNAGVTRRLRILKYRGSTHGTNEYPFLIDEQGMSILPVSSLGLKHTVSNERVSSGVPALDQMLGGEGFFRGSSILVTGGSGTGKTSTGAHFVDAACRRGESAVYFAFEESPDQIIRNMGSIGLDLRKWTRQGLLQVIATRPAMWGLEMHLVRMHKILEERKPRTAVLDPISSLIAGASESETRSMVLRIVDHLKTAGTTTLFTASTSFSDRETTEFNISSLVDTWLQLRNLEVNGERNRVLYVLKSRGMPHSNQVREFLLTSNGVELRPVYLGPGGVLTGSARLAQEAREREEEVRSQQESDQKRAAMDQNLRTLNAQIQGLLAEKEAREREIESLQSNRDERQRTVQEGREALARSRSGDPSGKKSRAQKSGAS
jgi:circadian clock protein KaiC